MKFVETQKVWLEIVKAVEAERTPDLAKISNITGMICRCAYNILARRSKKTITAAEFRVQLVKLLNDVLDGGASYDPQKGPRVKIRLNKNSPQSISMNSTQLQEESRSLQQERDGSAFFGRVIQRIQAIDANA